MKNILLISSLFLLFSCGNPLIKETEAEVVVRVNSTEVDAEYGIKNAKYIVRTQNITLATDRLYNVGDTLKIGKK
jgi:hypothetical protein